MNVMFRILTWNKWQVDWRRKRSKPEKFTTIIHLNEDSHQGDSIEN
jgi:hypothetical protein